MKGKSNFPGYLPTGLFFCLVKICHFSLEVLSVFKPLGSLTAARVLRAGPFLLYAQCHCLIKAK